MHKNHPQLSYWEARQYFEEIDLLIVGSGIVGLSAAVYLKEQQADLRVTILERGPLPSGASTRNAGFACFGSPSELLDDLAEHSEEEVFALVEKRWRGLSRLRQRLGDQAIGYREWGGYELFREGEESVYADCRDQMAYLNREVGAITGRKEIYQLADEAGTKYGFAGLSHLLVNTAEGQIDTGKMMQSLCAKARELGVQIINGLGVAQVQSRAGAVELTLDRGWEIQVPRVLVCTNGFTPNLFPDLEVLPARNQVLITQPIPDLKIKGCFHYDRGYYYFRNIDFRILLGGGRNLAPEVEQTNAFGTTSLIQEELTKLLKEVILPGQDVAIDRWWSGILGIGQRKTPIIEEIAPNLAVAVRMGGMGIAIGSLVGEEGAALLIK